VRLQVLEEDEAAARELMQQTTGDQEPEENVEG
jgi:hypothetical protein